MLELQGQVPGCRFDMNRSGAAIAWNYFHPHEPLAEILAYVQDRDLWQWKLPNSREINEALQQTNLDFALWSNLSIPELLAQGRPLYQASQRRIDQIVENTGSSDILGFIVPSVETDTLVSDTAERLIQLNPEAPFVAVYNHAEDVQGRTFTKFSLRSDGRTDVSAIARQLDGGGHANAAGFTITENPPASTAEISRRSEPEARHLPNPDTEPQEPAHDATQPRQPDQEKCPGRLR